MRIVEAETIDRHRLRSFVVAAWHSEQVVAHGERIAPAELPGFVALDGDRIIGHASYRIVDGACELTSIAAKPRLSGVGSRLLAQVVEAARTAGSNRLWLTTTNDNLDALRFYQRRGFRLVVLRAGAVEQARRTIKPELPEVGSYGIPMRDEVDLELRLARSHSQ